MLCLFSEGMSPNYTTYNGSPLLLLHYSSAKEKDVMMWCESIENQLFLGSIGFKKRPRMILQKKIVPSNSLQQQIPLQRVSHMSFPTASHPRTVFHWGFTPQTNNLWCYKIHHHTSAIFGIPTSRNFSLYLFIHHPNIYPKLTWNLWTATPSRLFFVKSLAVGSGFRSFGRFAIQSCTLRFGMTSIHSTEVSHRIGSNTGTVAAAVALRRG